MKTMFFMFLLLPALAQASVYRCVIDGVTTFSQTPCAEDAEKTDYNRKTRQRSRYTPFSATAVLVETDPAQVELAKEKIRQLLKDPESAIFSDITMTRTQEVGGSVGVCGKVNARNSFGGYVGNRLFAVVGDFVRIWSDDSAWGTYERNLLIRQQCEIK